VPDVVLGEVVELSPGLVVLVVSFFLQAPSRAARTAAVSNTLELLENAFIVYSSFTSILCRCKQRRQVSPAMSLIATR
jgi:hypothetical protein